MEIIDKLGERAYGVTVREHYSRIYAGIGNLYRYNNVCFQLPE